MALAKDLPSADTLPLYGMVLFLFCCKNLVMILPFVDQYLGIPATEQRTSYLYGLAF